MLLKNFNSIYKSFKKVLKNIKKILTKSGRDDIIIKSLDESDGTLKIKQHDQFMTRNYFEKYSKKYK